MPMCMIRPVLSLIVLASGGVRLATIPDTMGTGQDIVPVIPILPIITPTGLIQVPVDPAPLLPLQRMHRRNFSSGRTSTAGIPPSKMRMKSRFNVFHSWRRQGISSFR